MDLPPANVEETKPTGPGILPADIFYMIFDLLPFADVPAVLQTSKAFRVRTSSIETQTDRNRMALPIPVMVPNTRRLWKR
jgi:hypothetical protein